MLIWTLSMVSKSDIACRARRGELEAVFAALTHRCCTRAAAGLCGERRPERTPPHAWISRGTLKPPAARARRGGGGAVRRDGGAWCDGELGSPPLAAAAARRGPTLAAARRRRRERRERERPEREMR